jgi:DNA processing protein
LFPARNRIISGLCRVTVLVEAAERSGALITASHAGEQGRTVMAVPGPIDSPASGGTHELLRKGAVLCRGVEDVLEELHGVSAVVQAEASAAPAPAGRRRGWTNRSGTSGSSWPAAPGRSTRWHSTWGLGCLSSAAC